MPRAPVTDTTFTLLIVLDAKYLGCLIELPTGARGMELPTGARGMELPTF
jgi:hypothetical protein